MKKQSISAALFHPRAFRVIVAVLFAALWFGLYSVNAQTVGDTVRSFLCEVYNTVLFAAGVMALIGCLGLALMYFSSTIPVLKQWKEENPRAAGAVVTGMFVLLLVSGGTVAGVVGSAGTC